MQPDRWEDAAAYDRFMGRWSRPLALEFVSWLDLAPAAHWLEIGCGTGSLTSAIYARGRPAAVTACDRAPAFVRYCREHLPYDTLHVTVASTDDLPARAGGFDAVVSSLVLNFLPDPVAALGQMRAVCAADGCVAACVWDYAGGMEFLRLFWDAAVALDPAAEPLHEGTRFPLCTPEALRQAFTSAGLTSVAVAPLTVATAFTSFDDFWAPFLAATGPAPTYVASLAEPQRHRLAEHLRSHLFEAEGAPRTLHARAWAVRGQHRA